MGFCLLHSHGTFSTSKIGDWCQLEIGGWRLVAVGNWRLVAVAGWWLVAVGGWRWRLAVGGWQLVFGSPWGLSLRAVLNKNKKRPGFLKTAPAAAAECATRYMLLI